MSGYPDDRFAPVNTLTPLMRAEWIKLRSLRSSEVDAWLRWYAVTVGLGALFSALMAASLGHTFAAQTRPRGIRPTKASPAPRSAQLAVAVFGCLAITAEDASGTIRSSVAAAPRRTPLWLAKALVYGGVALVVGEVISFASYFIGQALYSGHARSATSATPASSARSSMTGGYFAWSA